MRKFQLHFFLLLFFLAASLNLKAAGGRRVHLIPEPVSVKEQAGEFTLDNTVSLELKTKNKQLQQSLKWFSQKIQNATGIDVNKGKGSRKILIVLNTDSDTVIGREGYHLKVSPESVTLTANTAAGAFYGLQSIIQLLPAEIEAKQQNAPLHWTIPAVEITDYPRFGWRGLMLDVSRHFFTKEEVKGFIDEMVKYKYNTFHWHLTDDQGWRIEIKSLPELTKKGAFSVKRTGRWGTFLPALANEESTYGGFYTQEDIKEIVKYAQDRYVTVLPEIDVPGHSLALITTYPSLSSTRKQYSVNSGWRTAAQDDNSLDPSNEDVYKTLDKVFTEVAKLFPCQYIHVGGDEAYKGYWEKNPACQKLMADKGLKNVEELQSYFIKRLEKILQSKSKKLIGWDEILQGGLAPSATVMSWRGMNGGIEAAKMGHPVVMTPWDYVYLDLYQGDPLAEPDTYGLCRLSDSYNYEPVPAGIDEKLILGGQGNLWTESVPTYRHMEYMVWPRSIALSEVYWSPKSKKNWPDFFSRLENEFTRMDAADINYAKSCYNVIFKPAKEAGSDVSLTMATEVPGLEIYYTFDNTFPDLHAAKYDGSVLNFPMGATQIDAITYRNGKPIGKQINIKKEELIKRSETAGHVY
ncbi:beta-N-acetylhexosaminidase [Pedobacter hartonius]|uniref:beta-N-acetylhexosaminidase n=1 Tax=Pedobacter hartonius TaxID=425514 RepID=A0A1H4AWH1_9SPHI|nr:family 20 glycosylhydrolase [Pedobacter hartonius]SEA40243.1 hexosaminidase [Pedobacter hartonius]